MANPLVVGNWKMNTTRDEASALARAIVSGLQGVADNVEVVVCPPHPWLTDVARVLEGTSIELGAQNMHTESSGAYTGEVSPRMLRGICQYVLVGQYERRIYFHEKDAIVRRKLQVAQQHGLKPILCVGDNADQLEEGVGPYVIAEQLEAGLEGATLDERMVVAYDPSWTTMGRVAPPPLTYVRDVLEHIRETLRMLYGGEVAAQTRVIYGGSVNPRNIDEIAAERAIDGVLAGTASVNAQTFAAIVKAFANREA